MIKIKNASFAYSGESAGAQTGGVRDISLTIPEGQFVVLCGESGCGKTTVTRLINGLIPNYFEGELSGEVRVNGKDVSHQPLYDTASMIASVFQNPRSQFFNVDTTGEITFGCENLGIAEDEIRRRRAAVTAELRAEKLLGRNIFHLSGGETQKVACAGAAIMMPEVLVLDEPSSNLDAPSILDLRATLAHWKAQGKTVVISEHRLYYLRGLADRFVYMKDGRIARDMTAEEFAALSSAERGEMGLRCYDLSTLTAPPELTRGNAELALKGFRFAYKNAPETLHVTDCAVPAGEIVAIIGANGAGKSTFSRCFCGLEKRVGEVVQDGTVLRASDRLSACYMVMQDVNHQLFTESVLDEVLISMAEEDEGEAMKILAALDLDALAARHPMSLSGGQKQRVAVATALASERSILFFDEPTSGLDCRHMHEVAEVLKKLRRMGRSIFVVTHDPELILTCCTCVLHFEEGNIAAQYRMDADGVARLRRYFGC